MGRRALTGWYRWQTRRWLTSASPSQPETNTWWPKTKTWLVCDNPAHVCQLPLPVGSSGDGHALTSSRPDQDLFIPKLWGQWPPCFSDELTNPKLGEEDPSIPSNLQPVIKLAFQISDSSVHFAEHLSTLQRGNSL